MPQSRHQDLPLPHEASGLFARAVPIVGSPQPTWTASAFLAGKDSTMRDDPVVLP